MSVEYCVVSYLDLVVDVEQLLHILVVVLHVISLPYVAYNACIESFAQEFKRPDSECVARLQIVELVIKQPLV